MEGVSNTCPSCGFTAHTPVGEPGKPARSSTSRQSNPITPIPARASARRAQSRSGMVPRRNQAEAGSPVSAPSTASSVQPGGGWQHESISYEAASSLSSLSLIISETPTAPPRSPRSVGSLAHIDEIDTVPQISGQAHAIQHESSQVQAVARDMPETPFPPDSASQRFGDLDVSHLAVVLSETTPPVPFTHIDEIDTVPESGALSSRALAPLDSAAREEAVDAASWTAGSGTTRSLAARFMSARSPRRRRSRTFTPLDRTRWWLLRPGHIEFLLWMVGSLLLFGVTFVILLATVLSVMLPGLQSSGNFPNSTTQTVQTTPAGSAATSASLHLALAGKTILAPGNELHLQGVGFHPQSRVVFLLDGRQPLLDQRGQAASVQADKGGHFAVDLWLGQGSAWSTGSHQVLARETSSGHQVSVAITIVTSASNPGGVQNTPVLPADPTSVPPTATPVPSQPTPEPTPATPTLEVTPTPATDPASSPTKSATGTPELSDGSATPTNGQPSGSSSLGNSLTTEDSTSLFARLSHLNPLVWLIGVCYFISLVFLGLAGLLRRR